VFLLLARVPMPTVRQLSAMSAKRHTAKAQELAKDVSYGSGDEQDLGDDAGNDAADDYDDEVCWCVGTLGTASVVSSGSTFRGLIALLPLIFIAKRVGASAAVHRPYCAVVDAATA
jgi:hypothetical protein